MAIQEKLYNIDDVWQLAHLPENENLSLYLIDGELYSAMRPGGEHGQLAAEIAYFLLHYVKPRQLGAVTVESGYYPSPDRSTVLGPDVAFIRKARMPQPFPKRFLPMMPDLAVEVLSPRDSLQALQRKAAIYLDNGATLVWIVLPSEQAVDVCRRSADAGLQITRVSRRGRLTGEPVLPGFSLDMKLIFPSA